MVRWNGPIEMSLHNTSLAVDVFDSIRFAVVQPFDTVANVLDNLVASHGHWNVLLKTLV